MKSKKITSRIKSLFAALFSLSLVSGCGFFDPFSFTSDAPFENAAQADMEFTLTEGTRAIPGITSTFAIPGATEDSAIPGYKSSGKNSVALSSELEGKLILIALNLSDALEGGALTWDSGNGDSDATSAGVVQGTLIPTDGGIPDNPIYLEKGDSYIIATALLEDDDTLTLVSLSAFNISLTDDSKLAITLGTDGVISTVEVTEGDSTVASGGSTPSSENIAEIMDQVFTCTVYQDGELIFEDTPIEFLLGPEFTADDGVVGYQAALFPDPENSNEVFVMNYTMLGDSHRLHAIAEYDLEVASTGSDSDQSKSSKLLGNGEFEAFDANSDVQTCTIYLEQELLATTTDTGLDINFTNYEDSSACESLSDSSALKQKHNLLQPFKREEEDSSDSESAFGVARDEYTAECVRERDTAKVYDEHVVSESLGIEKSGTIGADNCTVSSYNLDGTSDEELIALAFALLNDSANISSSELDFTVSSNQSESFLKAEESAGETLAVTYAFDGASIDIDLDVLSGTVPYAEGDREDTFTVTAPYDATVTAGLHSSIGSGVELGIETILYVFAQFGESEIYLECDHFSGDSAYIDYGDYEESPETFEEAFGGGALEIFPSNPDESCGIGYLSFDGNSLALSDGEGQELFLSQTVEEIGSSQWYAAAENNDFAILTIDDYDSGEVELQLNIDGANCAAYLNTYGEGVDDLEAQLAANGQYDFELNIQPTAGIFEIFEESYLAATADNCQSLLPSTFAEFETWTFSFN